MESKIIKYIKLSNIELSELGRNFDAIRLHKGSFVIPVPFCPYDRSAFETIEDFHNSIKYQLCCVINFLIYKYLCFNSNADESDERCLFTVILRLFKKHFISEGPILREDCEMMQKIYNRLLLNEKKMGPYVFKDYMKKEYGRMFVGKKAKFVCVKDGTKSRYERSGIAHSAHKSAKEGAMFDVFVGMSKKDLKRFFKVERVKDKSHAFGKKKVSFTNHDELGKKFNKKCEKCGLHGSGERSVYYYLRGMLDSFGMSCKSFYKFLLNKSLDTNISDLEGAYSKVLMARMFKDSIKRRNWVFKFFDRFLLKDEDVGVGFFDFYDDNYRLC